MTGGRIATETYVDAEVAGIVDAAPGTLDTLNELAAALGDDANFATTVTNALALKAPLASPAFTGTPTGITKTHVGLGNVDNTSDANKPVSTAQQTALNLKANLASPTFTGTVTIPTGASITAPTGLVKGDVGLGNVDNTADSAKAFAGSQITSGTVAEARIDATIARDSEVTSAVAAEATLARNADNLTSGTVAVARLPLDADVATLSLPASTTISAFGASLIDDAAASNARTTLGLGTAATSNTGDFDAAGAAAAAQAASQPLDSDLTTLAANITAFGHSLVDDANAAAALTTLGLDADLATFAVPASTTISAFGATLVDDADNTAARTTLGLGTMATQAETGYALLAGRAGGQTLIGGTAANEDLILKATSHATDASSFIDAEHNIRVRPTAFTTTDNTGGGIRLFQAGVGVITLNAASDNCLYGGVVGGGTVVFNADGLAAAAVRGFFVTESVVRNATEVTVNLTGAVRGHFLSPVIQVDATPTTGTATLTAPNFTIFRAEGSMSRRNSGVGTLNCTDFIGVHITTGVVGTGCTVTTRTACLISNPSAPTGTITTFIGLDIVNQTRATTNIGLRNAATTVFTSTSYTVGAGGGSVPVTSTFVKLTGVNTGTMVLGTPSITTTGAQNGQLLFIQNTDTADSVTFVNGTNLDLPGAANLTLGPKDTAIFLFDGTNWVHFPGNN